MNTLHMDASLKVAENSRTFAEIGDTELLHMAREAGALKGQEALTNELREFALHVAEACASIVDRYQEDSGSAGEEIRKLFKIDSLHRSEQIDMPAG